MANKRGRPAINLNTTKIGGYIRAYRLNPGKSLKELGDKLDMSAQHLSNVEQGFASLPSRCVKSLAEITGDNPKVVLETVMLSRKAALEYYPKITVIVEDTE